MKINKWEDLENVKNNDSKLQIMVGTAYIKILEGLDILLEIRIYLPKDIILKTLTLYGFDVEFEQKKISRWELAKKEDWSFEKLIEKYHRSPMVWDGRSSSLMKFVDWLSELVPVEGE